MRLNHVVLLVVSAAGCGQLLGIGEDDDPGDPSTPAPPDGESADAAERRPPASDAAGDVEVVRDAGPDVSGNKRVFVTTQAWGANTLDGSIATLYCATAAQGGAWDPLLDGLDSITGSGPWYRKDRVTLVAKDKAALAAGSLDNAIDPTAGLVWTGTTATGTAGANCGAWTDNAPTATGLVGDPSRADVGWVAEGSRPCNAPQRIYCFEKD